MFVCFSFRAPLPPPLGKESIEELSYQACWPLDLGWVLLRRWAGTRAMCQGENQGLAGPIHLAWRGQTLGLPRHRGTESADGHLLNIIGQSWNRLPREAGDIPSLKAFRAGLDEALGSLIYGVAVLPTAWSWKWLGFVVSSILSLSMILCVGAFPVASFLTKMLRDL